MFIRDLCGRFDIAKVKPLATYTKRSEGRYSGKTKIVPKVGIFGTIRKFVYIRGTNFNFVEIRLRSQQEFK